MDQITVKGARTHNLKNIDLVIPRNKLTVITGLSGSGKSSIAFDTLYAEGQRRYVESLSAYARQFLSLMEKPDVDHISGLSPAIAIEQKTTSHNPRSTVGTVTEIYDYLRVLFARVGDPKCPEHKISLQAQTITEMVDHALLLDDNLKLIILAPVVFEKKGEHTKLLEKVCTEGFLRVRINGDLYHLDDLPSLDRYKKHTIEVVIDRFKPQVKNIQRISESFETAINMANGLAKLACIDNSIEEVLFSSNHACPKCNYALNELSPRTFSFNSPSGACSACEGLGEKNFFDPEKVIFDETYSISQGAIIKWDKKSKFYYVQLEALAEDYGFDLKTPFKDLSEDIKKIIIYGCKSQILKDKGNKKAKAFEGVIPHFQRRYLETESEMIRDELAKLMSNLPCPECNSTRLNINARNVFISDKNISDITKLSIKKISVWLSLVNFEGQKKVIASRLLNEILSRLKFLINVGLDYLSLSRQAGTLSGGESQRIRLASQIGAGLVGVMYILDEPSIGLHQRDNQKLLDTLYYLRDLGNTVIVVEHDEDAIRQADHIIDIGPGAGVHGGSVIAEGSILDICKSKESLTAAYLDGRKSISLPIKRLEPLKDKWIYINNITGNNLHKVNLKIPIGLLTCVSGVSGSGKSTLINRTLYPLAAKILNRNNSLIATSHGEYGGFEYIDKVIDIDQSPIGRTPRSNPATYTGVFTSIRDLFASTNEAKSRAYNAGRFSFNVKGGRCESCKGDGVIKVEMHFLADVYVTCDTCQGMRYNRETLTVEFKGKNIHQVLDMSVEEAVIFFDALPSIRKRLQTLMDVGLSYIKLGQNATTLSGGEAQRVKLSKELSKTATGKTLYIFDEPTTGLHFHDIDQLLTVIRKLRDHGNTIVIIEHNLDVIKVADWVIDLGPEGGDGGGKIIAEGSPEKIATFKNSHTGIFLKPLLDKSKSLNEKNKHL